MEVSIKKAAAITITKAAAKWPSSFVARTKVRDFTGGLYSPGYLANQDSEGVGPKGAFKVGRQMCYPVESLTEWLVKRLED